MNNVIQKTFHHKGHHHKHNHHHHHKHNKGKGHHRHPHIPPAGVNIQPNDMMNMMKQEGKGYQNKGRRGTIITEDIIRVGRRTHSNARQGSKNVQFDICEAIGPSFFGKHCIGKFFWSS